MTTQKKSTTEKFHKGSGWNYRVTYNHDAQLTYITRYYTDGHVNDDDQQKTFFEIKDIESYSDAESVFFETGVSLITEEQTEIVPSNKKAAKARKKALNKALSFDIKNQDRAFEGRFQKAIERCEDVLQS